MSRVWLWDNVLLGLSVETLLETLLLPAYMTFGVPRAVGKNVTELRLYVWRFGVTFSPLLARAGQRRWPASRPCPSVPR